MFKRLSVLSCACVFMFLAACGGSKTGSASSYSSGGDWGDDPPPKANELKESHDEAVKLTEDNHKLAKEIFDLKNKLGLPTDE